MVDGAVTQVPAYWALQYSSTRTISCCGYLGLKRSITFSLADPLSRIFGFDPLVIITSHAKTPWKMSGRLFHPAIRGSWLSVDPPWLRSYGMHLRDPEPHGLRCGTNIRRGIPPLSRRSPTIVEVRHPCRLDPSPLDF